MIRIRLQDRGTVPLLLTLLLLGITVAPAADGGTLFYNGKVASKEVRTINGVAYVRLSDVAKALDMVAVKRANGYELTRTGGANQVQGLLQGRIGDQLFDGKWRFQVLSVETVDSYTLKTDGEPYPYDAPVDYNSVRRTFQARAGQILVVVHCRVANGQKTAQTLWIARQEMNTALTDTNGESYPPIAHDVTGAPIQTKSLLPGAKLDLPLVFVVPKGTTLKDLVFTLRNNESGTKGNDVRVSLAAP